MTSPVGYSKTSELLIRLLDSFPRFRLSHLPTPLERLGALSRELEGVNLFIKRDDQTGLAFGGNKARKLDFIIADVLEQNANCLITWAGLQSNWCRQTAAAAIKLGIKPVLILFKRPSLPADFDGNLLLDHILGAKIQIVELGEKGTFMEYAAVKEVVEAVADEERGAGNRPYIAPIGGSLIEGSMTKPWGAISYVNAMVELLDQAAALNVEIDYVVHATGSGSTQAGLIVGAKLLKPDLRVVGISVAEDRATISRYVQLIADRTFQEFGMKPGINDEDIIVFDEYVKEGYGILNGETIEAIRFLASSEGILLDPVYTGKAMAGLNDLIKQRYFRKNANIVFLHSGGTPALFPYRKPILAYLNERELRT